MTRDRETTLLISKVTSYIHIHKFKSCLLFQEHVSSLMDSVAAYAQRESEEELEKLLNDLAFQCQQDPRLRDQVKSIVYDFPSVVSALCIHCT